MILFLKTIFAPSIFYLSTDISTCPQWVLSIQVTGGQVST